MTRKQRLFAKAVVGPDHRAYHHSGVWWTNLKVTSGGMVQKGKGKSKRFFTPSLFVPWHKARSFL
ncbi:MAG: hypothetical protein ACK4SL_03845 [Candidatus Paceibacteria bacterium]